jgi:hypothetical protein
MFKTSFTAFLVLASATAVFGQQYDITKKKAGNQVITEVIPDDDGGVQAKPVIPGKGKPVAPAKVDPKQPKPLPVDGNLFVDAEAVSAVVPVELWMGSRKFVDNKNRAWQLVYGSGYAIQPTRIPGWLIRTEQNREFFFTSDGHLFSYTGVVDLEAIRSKIAN